MCPTCSASHEGGSGRGGQTQNFHIKKPVLLLLWYIFLLQSKTRKTILTELHGKFCRPSALVSSAFGRAELRTLIIKSRHQKRWGRDHLLQEILVECGSSSSLFLQCHLPHLSQGSKLGPSRWHVGMDGLWSSGNGLLFAIPSFQASFVATLGYQIAAALASDISYGPSLSLLGIFCHQDKSPRLPWSSLLLVTYEAEVHTHLFLQGWKGSSQGLEGEEGENREEREGKNTEEHLCLPKQN